MVIVFYERFVDLCNKHGTKPSAVAVSAGISKSTVSVWKKKWLSGEDVSPDQHVINRLCTYFSVPETELRGLDSPPPTATPLPSYLDDPNSTADFTQWLQSTIDEYNLTIYQISKISGVHQSTIANWLAGAKPQEQKKNLVKNAIKQYLARDEELNTPVDAKASPARPVDLLYPPAEQELIALYRKATPDDKAVVDMVLKKYKSPSQSEHVG